MRIAKYFLCFCFMMALVKSNAQQQPIKLEQSLDSLQKNNNVAEWLYKRIDYSYTDPKRTLNFLMDTEKKLWRPAKSNPEKEAMLILYSNQAYNQLFSGNILESITRYEKAYNYFIENNLNVGGIADYIFKPWANNYTRLGDYEKALFIQKQTLIYALKENDVELIASTYNNMAISFRSLGDLKQAEKYVKLGIQRLPISSPSFALLNNTLADIYKDGDNSLLADSVIQNNIQFQKHLKPNFETAYWLMSSYTTAGDIQLKKKNYQQAERYYRKAADINETYYKGERRREKAYIITQLGNIMLELNKPKDAIKFYDQTLNTLGLKSETFKNNELFGDNRLVDALYQRALAQLKLGQPKSALSNVQFSLVAADKIRFELADVKTKQRFQVDTKKKAEMAVSIAFSLLEKTGKYQYASIILDLLEQTKARTLLDEIRRNNQQLNIKTKDPLMASKENLELTIAYNERESLLNPSNAIGIKEKTDALKFKLEVLQKKLVQRYPAFSTGEINNKQSASEMLATLPRYGHLIEYFVGQDYIYALEIKNRSIIHVKRILNAPKARKLINDFVGNYFQNGPDAMMNAPKTFYSASNQIYNLLLGGLKINEQEKLTIIPDEMMGYLSFDGLITDSAYVAVISKWPFLIKKHSISYGFSLQTLNNQAIRKKRISNGFTGLFISHEKDSNQPIPAVIKEADAIKKTVTGKYLNDGDANRKAFNTAFANTEVLHISTHAYLSGNQKEPTLALNDGALFLFELSASRSAPSLVILSACRTADGLMAAGEGIMSLSRGFTALGAKGTIAGLWNVNDNAAAEITASCYKGILKGKEIGTALHLAKLKWLNGVHNGEQEFLPYYWDALIYMGHDQKIGLKAPASQTATYLIYLSGSITLAVLILLVLKRWLLKVGSSKK